MWVTGWNAVLLAAERVISFSAALLVHSRFDNCYGTAAKEKSPMTMIPCLIRDLGSFQSF